MLKILKILKKKLSEILAYILKVLKYTKSLNLGHNSNSILESKIYNNKFEIN